MSRNLQIYNYLQSCGWLKVAGPQAVTFLAAGEYNENHLVRAADGGLYVFRINHGSQLGLEDQIGYEFRVLSAVEPSGVTPKPLQVDPVGSEAFPHGVLLMEYLPGGPLEYERDWRGAAEVFSAVHAVPVPEGLVVQADPVRDIAAESLELVHRFPDHPRARERDMILRYRDTVLELAEASADLFASDPFCVVNTEVNSGNFIVDREGEGAGQRVKLVDWEKGVISSRFQDLGHFLVPTTTLWKTDFRFDDEGKRAFVSAYRDCAGLDLPLNDCLRGADVMERTILLRAMSWCFMAWYEYTRPGRQLRNEFTFGRIQRYLDEMECFLASKS